MISLLSKIYNQVKDVFVKPKLRFRICLCKNAYFLPFNIYAPVIWLTKDISYYFGSNKKCYRIQNILVKGIDNKYFLTNHKFPSEFVWRRDIRKKLKKYHLSWIKPCYTLPFFFKFKFDSSDLIWKTKYGDYRFEYPPQINLVLFGILFNIWLEAPKDDRNKYNNEDYYWESILTYLDYKDIVKTDKVIGSYTILSTNKTYKILSLNYLKEPYKSYVIKSRNVS